MKITNELGLPQSLVNAVSTREPADSYSASMLNNSPRMVWLQRRHHGEMTEDVADRIWAIFGTAVHAIVEQTAGDNVLTEERLEATLENGVKLTGIADLYNDGKIQDWKTVSVWSLIYMDDRKRYEYEVQLNIYAYLYRSYGFPVDSLEIVMLMRDWQASKAKFDSSYPQRQVHRLPIRLWDDQEIEDYLLQRTDYHEQFRDTPDDELPECTPEERWVKPSQWAVMKPGRKSAIKLHDTQETAEAHANTLHTLQGYDFYVEERPGDQWKRCGYCAARPFCNQTGYQEGA